MELKETFERVKKASKSLALLTDAQRNDVLNAVADAIIAQQARILKANAQDLAKMDMVCGSVVSVCPSVSSA